MDYQTLKRDTIEQIRQNPVSFLYAMFGLGGVFFDGPVTAPLPQYRTAIAHVADDGEHISLSVTVWAEGKAITFDKATYKAHSVPSENGQLLWESDGTTYEYGDDYEYCEAERFMDKLIFGVAFSEWENLVGDIAARGDSKECAWLFPCGLKPALNHAGMMMFASNRA